MTAPQLNRSRQFVAFVLVGVVAAAVNWGSRFGFSAAGLPLSGAIVCAFVMGVSTAYVLNRRFVFAPSGNQVSAEMGRFLLVNLVALAQVWSVTLALHEWVLPAIGFTWRPDAVAHAVGVASPVFTSYVAHRHFTFRKAERAKTSDVADPAASASTPP